MLQSGDGQKAGAESSACLRRQTAFDWDTFDVGDAGFTAAQTKPARADFGVEPARDESRQEKPDVGARATKNGSNNPGALSSRTCVGVLTTAAQKKTAFDDIDDDGLL